MTPEAPNKRTRICNTKMFKKILNKNKNEAKIYNGFVYNNF